MADFDRKEPGADVARERAGAHEETGAPIAFDGRRISSATAPPAMLQLQRLAGNRAVRSMIPAQRRVPAGQEEEIARDQAAGEEAAEPVAAPPGVERRAPAGVEEEIARAARPGGRTVVPGSNPFDFTRGRELAVQRYKTSAGYKKTAVTIESADFSATAVSALFIKKTPTRLQIGTGPNPAYTAKGKATITGDAAEVGQYEIGFLQTVFESNRDFYYSSKAEPPGKGAKKMTDYTKSQPGRDGDTGFEPWYGAETVFPFGAKAADTQTTRMDDTPSSGNPWIQDFGKGPQKLVKTGGKDVFVSWLAVRNKRTKAVKLLNNANWNADYGADVVVDEKTPANSTVTPSSGQAAVTGTGDGQGSKTPIYKDPVANDAAWKTTAW